METNTTKVTCLNVSTQTKNLKRNIHDKKNSGLVIFGVDRKTNGIKTENTVQRTQALSLRFQYDKRSLYDDNILQS